VPTRILIVAEIRLYREGLQRSLQSLGYDVAATAAGPSEAAAALAQDRVDAVLIDMAGAEGTEAARQISERWPATTIVALAVPEEEGHVLACAEAGVSSYVPREASLADLAAAIEAAARGEVVCPPQIAASLFRRVRVLSRQRPPSHELPALTTRQWEILDLIDEGLSNKEIAGRLYIEVPTVKNHIHNILDKLQVRRRSEAAARVRGLRDARRYQSST
jgi:DNA-binding NarL/FixJ family response regulator